MEHVFDNCIFFRLNKIIRTLSQHADAAFSKHNLSSSHAYLLILVKNNPKIGTVELANILNLSPSTITRLVDKLEIQHFVFRERIGKRREISCTGEGSVLAGELFNTWLEFRQQMQDLVGLEVYKLVENDLPQIEAKIFS
ncbi:MAG: MarR family winged helix-turn-helix transcriptional regulator [Mangrovibacterium sp.]